METGTGKTYVYTKAMFELNRRYGWCKFIVVVPSVAIREGTYKSLQNTKQHFSSNIRRRYSLQLIHNFVAPFLCLRLCFFNIDAWPLALAITHLPINHGEHNILTTT